VPGTHSKAASDAASVESTLRRAASGPLCRACLTWCATRSEWGLDELLVGTQRHCLSWISVGSVPRYGCCVRRLWFPNRTDAAAPTYGEAADEALADVDHRHRKAGEHAHPISHVDQAPPRPKGPTCTASCGMRNGATDAQVPTPEILESASNVGGVFVRSFVMTVSDALPPLHRSEYGSRESSSSEVWRRRVGFRETMTEGRRVRAELASTQAHSLTGNGGWARATTQSVALHSKPSTNGGLDGPLPPACWGPILPAPLDP